MYCKSRLILKKQGQRIHRSIVLLAWTRTRTKVMRCGRTSRSQTLLLNSVCVHVYKVLYSSTFTQVRVLYSSDIPIFLINLINFY